jgi:hypothetical protein
MTERDYMLMCVSVQIVSIRFLGGEGDFTVGCFQSLRAVDIFYQMGSCVRIREEIREG